MIVYNELESVERDLGIPVKTLYSVSNSLGKHYHSVSVPKRTEGERRLSVPDEILKKIQRRIHERLLAYEPVSKYATGYK